MCSNSGIGECRDIRCISGLLSRTGGVDGVGLLNKWFNRVVQHAESNEDTHIFTLMLLEELLKVMIFRTSSCSEKERKKENEELLRFTPTGIL
jgi:hypothetical protein